MEGGDVLGKEIFDEVAGAGGLYGRATADVENGRVDGRLDRGENCAVHGTEGLAEVLDGIGIEIGAAVEIEVDVGLDFSDEFLVIEGGFAEAGGDEVGVAGCDEDAAFGGVNATVGIEIATAALGGGIDDGAIGSGEAEQRVGAEAVTDGIDGHDYGIVDEGRGEERWAGEAAIEEAVADELDGPALGRLRRVGKPGVDGDAVSAGGFEIEQDETAEAELGEEVDVDREAGIGEWGLGIGCGLIEELDGADFTEVNGLGDCALDGGGGAEATGEDGLGDVAGMEAGD